MKKIPSVIFLSLFVLIIFSSCYPTIYFPPLGTWVSENPDIILHIDEDEYPLTEFANSGLYTVDGDVVLVRTFFHTALPRLEIYDANLRREQGYYGGRSVLLTGTIVIVDNQMYYLLSADSQERVGYDGIVFQKVEDENFDPFERLNQNRRRNQN